MHILHLGKYFPPFKGGLENYLRDLVLALAKGGVSSTVLVHRHQQSFKTQDSAVTLEGQAIRVVRVATWLKLFFTPISPCFPVHLRRLVAELRPDVLHLHLPNPSIFWALFIPGARRVPWVVHWHADVITEAQGWPMRIVYVVSRPFERAVLRRAKAIITTSAVYRDSSEPLRPWLAKCRVVPLGMDRARLPVESLQATELGGKVPRLQVLAVGRLTYYKGLRYLIEAAAEVPEMQVELVGDGDQAVELKHQSAALGLQGRVTFHGSVDDRELAEMMARCDCLCLPSIERTEAFGMVLLEAMSFGKATVVSDVEGSGMSYVVDHGVTGLKVPPMDVQALAAAFRQLAGNPALLREMGEAGKRRFERLFEISHTAIGVRETYQAVLGNQAGTGGWAART